MREGDRHAARADCRRDAIQDPCMKIGDRVAIVTGGGGPGTGRAIAQRLAGEGARIVVADIDDENGAETVRHIESSGGEAAFLRADVTSEKDVYATIGFAEETFGGLDILVNNAGVTPEPHSRTHQSSTGAATSS